MYGETDLDAIALVGTYRGVKRTNGRTGSAHRIAPVLSCSPNGAAEGTEAALVGGTATVAAAAVGAMVGAAAADGGVVGADVAVGLVPPPQAARAAVPATVAANERKARRLTPTDRMLRSRRASISGSRSASR